MANLITDEEIQEVIQQVVDAGYIKRDYLVGVFAYGKINYGLAESKKDIKICGFYIPTLRDFCFNKLLNDEEHDKIGSAVTFVDIRKLLIYPIENKYFINSLFSEYFYINPKYETLFNKYFTKQSIVEANKEDLLKKCVIQDGYILSYPRMRVGIMKMVKNSINFYEEEQEEKQVIKEEEKQKEEIKFTKTELIALKEIINSLDDTKQGFISISTLVENSPVSRPVFRNVLNKLEKGNLAKVESKGAKGTFIKLYKDFSIDNL